MSNVPKKVPDDRLAPVAIDDGFRAWYESCPCCLSHAHPKVKRVLDNEHVIRAVEDAAKR
jgi:hypothetical protein